MTKELDIYSKGYKQGFSDAKNIYDLKDKNEKSKCNCPNVMYCNGDCFPKNFRSTDLK